MIPHRNFTIMNRTEVFPDAPYIRIVFHEDTDLTEGKPSCADIGASEYVMRWPYSAW